MIKRFLMAVPLILMPHIAHAQASPMECQLLPVHTTAPDNKGADYKPGVDVKGKPVVPADLGTSAPSMLPRTIVVPLSVDLADRLRDQKIEGMELDAPLGMLEIHPDGRVLYNDTDLTASVYVTCGREAIPDLPEAGAKAAETKAPAPAQGDGQPKGDALQSEAVEVTPVPAIPPKSEIIEGGESRYEGYR